MRNKFIKIRVSDKELERVKERAEKAEMNVSEYIRRCAIDGKIILYDTKNVYGVKTVMKNIGNNINQIAAAVNANGSAYYEDVAALRKKVGDLEYEVREYLKPLNSREL